MSFAIDPALADLHRMPKIGEVSYWEVWNEGALGEKHQNSVEFSLLSHALFWFRRRTDAPKSVVEEVRAWLVENAPKRRAYVPDGSPHYDRFERD